MAFDPLFSFNNLNISYDSKELCAIADHGAPVPPTATPLDTRIGVSNTTPPSPVWSDKDWEQAYKCSTDYDTSDVGYSLLFSGSYETEAAESLEPLAPLEDLFSLPPASLDCGSWGAEIDVPYVSALGFKGAVAADPYDLDSVPLETLTLCASPVDSGYGSLGYSACPSPVASPHLGVSADIGQLPSHDDFYFCMDKGSNTFADDGYYAQDRYSGYNSFQAPSAPARRTIPLPSPSDLSSPSLITFDISGKGAAEEMVVAEKYLYVPYKQGKKGSAVSDSPPPSKTGGNDLTSTPARTGGGGLHNSPKQKKAARFSPYRRSRRLEATT